MRSGPGTSSEWQHGDSSASARRLAELCQGLEFPPGTSVSCVFFTHGDFGSFTGVESTRELLGHFTEVGRGLAEISEDPPDVVLVEAARIDDPHAVLAAFTLFNQLARGVDPRDRDALVALVNAMGGSTCEVGYQLWGLARGFGAGGWDRIPPFKPCDAFEFPEVQAAVRAAQEPDIAAEERVLRNAHALQLREELVMRQLAVAAAAVVAATGTHAPRLGMIAGANHGSRYKYALKALGADVTALTDDGLPSPYGVVRDIAYSRILTPDDRALLLIATVAMSHALDIVSLAATQYAGAAYTRQIQAAHEFSDVSMFCFYQMLLPLQDRNPLFGQLVTGVETLEAAGSLSPALVPEAVRVLSDELRKAATTLIAIAEREETRDLIAGRFAQY